MQVDSLAAFKAEIAGYLQALPSFRTAKVVQEYPAEKRPYPLRCPLLVVGVEGVELSEGAFGGYWGEAAAETASVLGRSMEISLRLDIFCAPEDGGGDCHRLWEALCEALVDAQCPFAFRKIRCGALAFDKALAANCLRVSAEARAVFSRSEVFAPIAGFDVQYK